MANGIFITATGTDIGKTYITAEIIRLLRDAGIDAGYYKAVLSGTELKEGRQIAGDAHYVYHRAGIKGDPNCAVTTILKYPASPHLSARMERKGITLKPIVDDYKKMADMYELLVMEGSGGLVCPLNLDDEKLMLTDVIKALSLDILLVADAGLGTINNVVLTLAYAKNLGITTRGIILNRYDPTSIIHADNKIVIEKMAKLPVVTCSVQGTLTPEIIKMMTAQNLTPKLT